MKSYVYEVLGRGNIVFAQTVQANDQTNHSFRFPCLLEMAPRARVLVYFTTETGEVVADSIMFEADGTFQNHVRFFVRHQLHCTFSLSHRYSLVLSFATR